MAELSFPLPDLGEGLEDAVILEWHVRVGDLVERNDVLVEVETTKSAVELPSPVSGVVARLGSQEGESVRVGDPLITFEVADETAGIVGTIPAADETPVRRVALRPPDDED
ncbi:biotin attachment protein [Microbacterium sp. zg.B48]|uniref:biotin/lipoyl-containing protein n=1 Tax=unclassified Microbacterium TaxID=2609290 RepID=UPI00214B6966|nr:MULTISPECIES: biotin/lipoyl-containing protein [unclassified Microbacterium]MCR2764031.1 biotin attachment protein [Microbacterium sp. zg.B48]MCR2810452.1 biotin attachment protein [Microbacterium sp. zg.B185]WIM18504.1 biotin/lipoyl-containing protein [Microbacterium sp. zg-B185]